MNKLITPKKTVIARKTLVSDEAISALLSLRGGAANEAISALSSSLAVKKKLNVFFTFFLVTAIILTPLSSLAQIPVCEMTPTCASLGYDKSEADCAGYRMLRCPLDSSAVYCLTRPLTTGDFLFGDGSTGSKLISGKTPIGIVFDTENKLAIALEDAPSTMYWSSSRVDLDLANCTDSNSVITTCGIDGKANTEIIKKWGGADSYAAGYCYKYAPSGVSVASWFSAGQWFLPSVKELYTVYQNKTAINSALLKLGKKALTENSYYWSSTEYSEGGAWYIRMSSGSRSDSTKVNFTIYVRPVIDFSNPNYMKPCSATYTFDSCDTSIGTCEECGGKYKYTACNNGWTLSSGNCVVNTCSGYPSTSSSISYCLATASCQQGNTTLYKCTNCQEGYENSSVNGTAGTCYPYECWRTCYSDSTYYFYDSRPSACPNNANKGPLKCYKNGWKYVCASVFTECR